MKLQFHDFSRKCQYPLLFAFGSMPLILSVFGALDPKNAWFTYIFTGIYILFAWLAIAAPGKFRFLLGALGAAVLFAAGHWSIASLIAVAFFAVLLFCSLRIGAWGWDDEVSLQGHLLGLTVHILCAVVPLFMGALGQQILGTAPTGKTVAFWVYSALVMLSMNRDSLFFAAKGKPQTSRSIRRRNTVMVASFFLLTSVISLVPAVGGLIRKLLLWLYDLFVNEPDPLEPINPNATAPTGGGGGVDDSSLDQEQNPLLEMLVNVLLQIALAVLLLTALYMAGRELYKRLPKLRQWLSRFTAGVSEDYTDEVTYLRGSETKDSTLLQRLRQLLDDRNEGDMTPEKRIRRHYRKLLRKNPQWRSGSTARENIPPEAAQLYEQARYSDHPVTQEEANRFRSETKRL